MCYCSPLSPARDLRSGRRRLIDWDDHDDGADDGDDDDDGDGSCSTSPTTDQIGEKMEFNECKMERLCTIRWMNIQTNLIEGGTVDIPTFVLLYQI